MKTTRGEARAITLTEKMHECSYCKHYILRAFFCYTAEKFTGGAYGRWYSTRVYVDSTGRQWKASRCPDCVLTKQREDYAKGTQTRARTRNERKQGELNGHTELTGL